jgi:hypothetical protein
VAEAVVVGLVKQAALLAQVAQVEQVILVLVAQEPRAVQ